MKPKPQHAHEVVISIGAHSMAGVVDILEGLLNEAKRAALHEGAGASPTGAYTLSHNLRDVSQEQYGIELDAWIADPDSMKPDPVPTAEELANFIWQRLWETTNGNPSIPALTDAITMAGKFHGIRLRREYITEPAQ